jgi:hypothetical protein
LGKEYSNHTNLRNVTCNEILQLGLKIRTVIIDSTDLCCMLQFFGLTVMSGDAGIS